MISPPIDLHCSSAPPACPEILLQINGRRLHGKHITPLLKAFTILPSNAPHPRRNAAHISHIVEGKVKPLQA
jgi:hypothetical protein